jgi:predicted CXXCH cytochrome family protein
MPEKPTAASRRQDMGGLLASLGAAMILLVASFAQASPDCTTAECHASTVAHEYLHGPVAANQCALCHEGESEAHPDAEGAEFSVAMGGQRELCLSCHEETLPKPLEKELHWAVACRDCHDPHGGKTRMLTERGGNVFCALCHHEVGAELDGHPLPGHPIEGKKLSCFSCHGAHAVRDVATLNVMEDDEAGRKFCLRCH